MLTFLEVSFHGGASRGIHVVLQRVGDLRPDMFAVDYHGLFPFSNGKRPNHEPPRPGASGSRSMRRARNSRVLTDACVIPRASAVSSMLKCCTSRSMTTSRYFAASPATALASL